MKPTGPFIILVFFFSTARLLLADAIIFPDGEKTQCYHRAWEEDGLVKCDIYGTTVSYDKKKVLRIEKSGNATVKTDQPAPHMQAPHTPAAAIDYRKMAASLKGIPFYDPRRPYKYWTGRNHRHRKLGAAIAALAAKFNQSPQWITAHMGDVNDLGVIVRNLGSGLDKESRPHATLAQQSSRAVAPRQKATPVSSDKPTGASRGGKNDIPPAAEPAAPDEKTAVQPGNHPGIVPERYRGIAFYNPRREHKFQSGQSGKHNTLEEAVRAIALKVGRQPDWVQANMGDSNDLEAIYRNLMMAMGKGTGAREPGIQRAE